MYCYSKNSCRHKSRAYYTLIAFVGKLYSNENRENFKDHYYMRYVNIACE